MGGLCTVAARLPSGRTFSRRFHTNEVVDTFKSPNILQRDETILLGKFATMEDRDSYGGEWYGRPAPMSRAEYGIVVIDYISNIIIDCQYYTSISSFSCLDRRFNRGRMQPCADAGMLSLRHRVFDPVEKVFWYEDGEGITGDQLIPIADKYLAMQYENHCWLNQMGEQIVTDFQIDYSPFRVIETDNERVMDEIRGLGLPMTAAEGLNPPVTSA